MHPNARFLAPLAVAVALAGGALTLTTAEEKPSGRDLYKAYCKPCHLPNSKNGEYTPMTLIGDQWTRFFEKKYVKVHEKVVDPNHDNRKVTDVISPENLESIRKFAVEHAADSEHPMTCG